MRTLRPIRGISTRTERVQAFSAALDHAGLATGQDVYEVDNEEQIRSSIDNFFANAEGHPKAIFAGNTVILLKAVLELQRQGIHVPREVAILGFDNPDWAEIVQITTLAQPTYLIVQAVEQLLKRINGEEAPYQHIALPVELMVRNSTPMC